MGILNPYDDFNTLIISIPLYIGFLYICYRKASLENQTKWTIILLIAASQYTLVYVFPGLQGYSGWLLFAFLLGRVMGLEHPEVNGFKELDRNRQLIGWVAIVIFVLCFTPQPFQIG